MAAPPLFVTFATRLSAQPLNSSDFFRGQVYGEWTARFVILDVEGETVVIDIAAPADKFNAFLPKAQEVLDTVEWKGG